MIYIFLLLALIYRLKDTWARVPKKSTHRYDKHYKLFNMKRNFQAYRAALQEYHGPVVPILSTIISYRAQPHTTHTHIL